MASQAEYFPDSLEEQFIDLVRERPIIYDVKKKSYKDAQVKHNNWKEIAAILNISIEVCKMKWKSLRDYYTRKKTKGSGSAGSIKTPKERQRMRALAFLGNTLFLERKTVSSIPDENVETFSTEEISMVEEDFPVIEDFSIEEECSASVTEHDYAVAGAETVQTEAHLTSKDVPPPKTEEQNRKIKSKELILKNILKAQNQRMNIMKQLCQPEKTDEIDNFCAYLNSTLRTLPRNLLIECKAELYQKVTEYERKALLQ